MCRGGFARCLPAPLRAAFGWLFAPISARALSSIRSARFCEAGAAFVRRFLRFSQKFPRAAYIFLAASSHTFGCGAAGRDGSPSRPADACGEASLPPRFASNCSKTVSSSSRPLRSSVQTLFCFGCGRDRIAKQAPPIVGFIWIGGL
jgi:hypothetical protein